MSGVDRWKLKLGKFYLILFCCVGAITTLIILFSGSGSWEDSPDPLAVADVSEHSAYVDEIASELSKDPVFVDPLLVDAVGESLRSEQVRSAIAASHTPVFIVALATSGHELERDRVLLARIADAVGRDGVYLIVDEDRRIDEIGVGDGFDDRTLFLVSPSPDILDAGSMAHMVNEVDGAVDQVSGDGDDGLGNNPFWAGGMLGLTFAVPLWYLMKFIRWSARRDRSYLKGFRE